MRTGYKKPLVALLSIAILISSFLTGTTLVAATPIVTDLIQALRYDTEAAIPEFATVNCDVILRVDMSSDSGTLIKDGVEINWPGTGFNGSTALGTSTEDYIVTVPGVYVASVTSGATTTVVHFTIDRTGPALTAFRSGTANPVLNGAYVRYDVEIVTEPETENTVYLDGVSIDWPVDATFADEGVYQIISTDLAGNFSTIGFTIDKTGPTIYLEYDYDHYPTLGPVLVTASTDEPALLNTVTHTFVADGYFYFSATDRAGNITIKQAHVDWIKTWAPTLHVQVDVGFDEGLDGWYATDLSDGAYTNDTVYAWVSDNWYSRSYVEVTRDGTLIDEEYLYNTSFDAAYENEYYWSFSSEGHYILTATDDLGNDATFAFIIDKTAPTISGVSDEGLYNDDVVITAADDHVLSSITLNDVPFTSGGTVSAEGEYTVVATDAAGNTRTYDFTIDLTAPTIVGVSDGSYYNVTKAPTFEVGATAKLNTVTYTSGTSISAEGVYTLVVTDAAGNTTTVEFTIDKTKPVIVVTYDPDTYDAEDWYNEDITVDAAFSDTYLTGDESDSHTFTENDEYTFTALDLAGNETTETITIENIDRQPDIYVNKPSTDEDLETGDRSNDSVDVSTWNSTTTTVTFTGMHGTANNYSNQPIASVSEDGEFVAGDYYTGVTNNTRVYRDGTYVVTATNAHDFSSSFTFILDAAYPRITINDYNEDWTNGNVLVTATTEAGATLNATRHLFTGNSEFTFTSIDALGNTQSVTIEIDNIDKNAYLDVEAYDYDDEYIHDIVDHEIINCSYIQIYTENYYYFLNSGLLYFDYMFESTDVVVKDGIETDWPQYGEFYVEGSYEVTTTDWLGNVSVIHFVIDRTDPEVTGVEDKTFYNSNRTITVTDLNLDTITLNGSAFVSGTTVSAEGSYDLIATDKAGNSILVEFILDKTAPAVTGVTNGSYSNSNKTITATDTYLATLKLNGTAFVSGTTVSTEGDYTLIATDHAGNSTTVVFTIDKTAPVIAGVADGLAYNTTRNPTATDLNLATTTLNGAAFVSGTAVSADGVYTLIATDKAGNATTAVFTVDKTAPFITGVKSGTIISVDGGATVHTDVTVTVATDAATYSVTKNGVAFAWPTANRFMLPATYVVTAADALGNTRTYTFVVMKPIITARKTGTTTYLTSGGYSNVNIFVVVTQYKTRSAKRNGVAIAWPYGGSFTLEGNYLITAKDSFGAVSTFSFMVHKIRPAVSMKTSSGTVIANGGSTLKNVIVRVTCPILASKTVKLNGVLIAWPVTNTFTVKGVYTITATDLAGNVIVRTFTRK